MDAQRVDKWLWCARFFKTRTLAHDAIAIGRVEVNGQRAKPAKVVTVGDVLSIKLPPYEFVVEVRGVAGQRQSAPLARALYAETLASSAARSALAERLRLSAVVEPRGHGRPSGAERRARESFERRAWLEADE